MQTLAAFIRKKLTSTLPISLILAILPTHIMANSELRDWKFTDGRMMNGEIATVDEVKGTFILRSAVGVEQTITIADLQHIDRAWLMEWIEMNEELEAKVKHLGGRLTHHEGKGEKYTTGFYVYEPASLARTGAARPLIMLFSPSGKPLRYLRCHATAAEAAKINLVTADYFRNNIPNEEYSGRFKELHPIISSTVKHDPTKFFLGGTSGGALGAFCLAAEFPENKVAGIYSNCGWLGPRNEARRAYPKMRVAQVNGNNDTAANSGGEMVTSILQQRGCTVSMFAFEGGHQIPPDSVQAKTFRWLLGEFE